MPDKDREIVVKIRCGEKMCELCRWMGYACKLFGERLELSTASASFGYYRCHACLAAEINTPSYSPAPQGAGKRNSVAGHPKKV